jgi:hypothetical protein
MAFVGCKTNEVGYRYSVAQWEGKADTVYQIDRGIDFVFFQGHLFEYDILRSTHTKFDVYGGEPEEVSRVTSYDTLGIYLIQPESGRYFRFQDTLGEYKFTDSGRFDQKEHGYKFDYKKERQKVFLHARSLRDTTIEGVKLKRYDTFEIDSVTNDSTVIRYHFFRDSRVKTIMTYGNATNFVGVNDMFRFDLNTKGMNFYMTVTGMKALSASEKKQFKRMLSQVP